MGRGLLQLQLDLRTPETLLRRSSCSREEAELQEGAAAASSLHSAPAASCSPGGGVRGGTAWPDLLHHHWSAIFRTHLRSLCPPSQGSKVFQSGLEAAAGSGLLQPEAAGKQGGEDDFSFLLLYCNAVVQSLLIRVPTQVPGFLTGKYEY